MPQRTGANLQSVRIQIRWTLKTHIPRHNILFAQSHQARAPPRLKDNRSLIASNVRTVRQYSLFLPETARNEPEPIMATAPIVSLDDNVPLSLDYEQVPSDVLAHAIVSLGYIAKQRLANIPLAG